MAIQTRIIDVYRKPRKCPVCGESVVDIIYETGDMTEYEFFIEYRKTGIMGGDNIPRRPPIWACACGCKRFRKINADGTDAIVKLKKLKDIKPAPISIVDWETSLVEKALLSNQREIIRHYHVKIVTELGETETLTITAVSDFDASDCAMNLVDKGVVGLKGRKCISIEVFDAGE